MKKLKGIFSFVLAAAMIFGCTSIFASAAHPDTILSIWDDEYHYSGEMTVGENTVTKKTDIYRNYYNFYVENEGYYFLCYDAESSIGELYNMEENYTYYSETHGIINSDSCKMFYFESGDNYIGVSFFYDSGVSEKITVEYAGKEITALDFDAGTEYPFVLDCDIFESYMNFIDVIGFEITFDNEKKYQFNDFLMSFDFHPSGEKIVIGANEVEIEIDGKRFAKTINVASLSDYIEKVEIAEGEIEETYYYDGSSVGSSDLVFDIIYKDGSKTGVCSGEQISLKNGSLRKFEVSCWFVDGDAQVYIGSNEVLDFKYETRQAGVAENLSVFFNNVKYEFEYIYRIPTKAEELFGQDSVADTLRAFGEFVSYINNNFFYAIGDIFEQLVMIFSAIS